MPWTPRRAGPPHQESQHAEEKKRQWAAIADSALERGESDKLAIMQANGVLKKEGVGLAKALGNKVSRRFGSREPDRRRTRQMANEHSA